MVTTPAPRGTPVPEQDRWIAMRMADNPRWRAAMPPARLMHVSEGLNLIIWNLVDGKPCVVDKLRVQSVNASFTVGLILTLRSQQTGVGLSVRSHPREIVPGLFFWIPPLSQVRFGPANYTDPEHSTWALSFPVRIRMVEDPEAVPEQYRVSTRKEFNDLWPDVSI